MRRIRLLVSSFQRIAFGPYTGTELDHLPSFKKKNLKWSRQDTICCVWTGYSDWYRIHHSLIGFTGRKGLNDNMGKICLSIFFAISLCFCYKALAFRFVIFFKVILLCNRQIWISGHIRHICISVPRDFRSSKKTFTIWTMYSLFILLKKYRLLERSIKWVMKSLILFTVIMSPRYFTSCSLKAVRCLVVQINIVCLNG